MYYSYIDASGKHLRKDYEDFVLNSVTICQSKQGHLIRQIDAIKQEHFPDHSPDSVEIHATDMVHHNGIFRKARNRAIYRMLDDLFGMLQDSELFIVTAVIKKPYLYLGTDIEKWAYKFLLERIDLEIKSKNETDNSDQKSILVIDSEGDRDYEVTKNIQRIIDDGTRTSDLRSISDEKILQDSKSSNLLQLSDAVAYAVRRRQRDGSQPSNRYGKRWKSYYSCVRKRFRKVKGRHYNHGLMVFPKINLLTTEFVRKRNISEAKVLEEPQEYSTEHGRKLQCVIGCDDGSIRMLDVTEKRQKQIQGCGFDVDSMLDKTLKLKVEPISKARNTVLIEQVYEKRWKHSAWYKDILYGFVP